MPPINLASLYLGVPLDWPLMKSTLCAIGLGWYPPVEVGPHPLGPSGQARPLVVMLQPGPMGYQLEDLPRPHFQAEDLEVMVAEEV